MLQYIKDNFGNRPSINEGERMELEFLRSEVKKLRTEIYGTSSVSPAGRASTAGDDPESSEDSEEEFVDDLPVTAAKPKGPRMSVSAEVFGKFNKQEDYVPPVNKKSPEQEQQLRAKMEKNFMFNTLNPKDKKSILEAVTLVTKKEGDVIIKQGDDGDNFYLVEQGQLNCTKFLNPSDEQETFLKEYQPGESFGELALLYNAPRAATITCKSPTCELWSLDRNTFNHIIKRAVQIKREKYDNFLEKVNIL